MGGPGILTAARAQFDAALAHHRAGRLEAALAGYGAAIAADPGYADALSNHGIVLAMLGRGAEAVASLDRAIAVNPGYADAHANRAVVLAQLGDGAAAIEGFHAAIAANPRHLPAALGLVQALLPARRFADAVGAADHALTLAPDTAELHFSRGFALVQLFLRELARPSFERAIALAPHHVEAHCWLAEILFQRRELVAALPIYDRILALAPDRIDINERRLTASAFLCDWDRVAADLAVLTQGLAQGRSIATPFTLLSISDDPALHARAAALHIAGHAATATPAARLAALPPGERLRIGYFSSDFLDHATMHLMADLFEAHDRSAFEISAFSWGPPVDDAWRARLTAACDRIVEIGGASDAEAAALARAARIDIAVDLKGFTAHGRPGIFAAGAAAVQASFLGYPGTTGAGFMDYVIADRIVLPSGADFAERLVWLPDCYQPNCRNAAAGPAPGRAALGLPEAAMVFASFNQAYKIRPDVFADWLTILAAVPGSVLWLWIEVDAARASLRAAARRAGVAADRLVFAGSVPRETHLARLLHADLMLDTFPCGAHTTCSDALRMGLPVLTRTGQSFASRVAASLLRAVDLSELVTENRADYVALAVALGNDRARLAGLRARLAEALPRSPLFDPKRFARDLEAGFGAMAGRARAGLPPADIDLAAPG